MKLKKPSIKPQNGYAAILHIIFNAALPLIIYVLIRLDFPEVAVAVILLGKWRMFSVKMRHWPANVRANAVDIIVGVSVVAFMDNSSTQLLQITWAFLYAIWLLVIKPQSSALWVGIQAMIGQLTGLMAIFLIIPEADTTVLVLAVWLVTYLAARHFLTAFDEAMSRTTAYCWAFFAGSLTWVSSKWLVYYGVVAQPVLLITVIGYGLAAIYYLQHTERLSKNVQIQFVSVMCAIVLFVLVFTHWTDQILL